MKEEIETILRQAEEKISKLTGMEVELTVLFKDSEGKLYNAIAGEFMEFIEIKTGYTWAQLRSRSRKRPLISFRQAIAKVLREKTNMTSAAVGRILNRDHATILHSAKQKSELFQIQYKETVKLYYDFMTSKNMKTTRPAGAARVITEQRHHEVNG